MSAFSYDESDLKEYTPLIHGILNPLHNGLILFILWIGYKVHRSVYRILARLGDRHINTIIVANLVRIINYPTRAMADHSLVITALVL